MEVATKAQEGSCVPRGWTHARLDEIADINPRFSAEGVSEETEVTFLPMKSVEEHSGQIDVSESKPISAVRKGYTPFRNGDVIFAKITPCMENGKVAVVEGLRNGLGFGSTEFHVVRPHDAVSRQFLFYFLVRDDFRRDAERNMTGTAGQRRVPTRYLQEAKIQLPSIPEQNRIVEKIEELFTKLNAGVRSLEQARVQLKSYRRSVLKAAVEGELSREWREAHGDELEPASDLLERTLKERREKFASKKYKEPASPNASKQPTLPVCWTSTTIGQVAECLDSRRVPVSKKERDKRQGKIPYYGANGQVGWIDDYIFDESIVLVVEDETFTGRKKPFSYKVEGQSWVNNHAHILRPSNAVTVDYLNYSLAHYPFTPLTTGTTGRKKLTQKALLQAPYSLPPLAEQEFMIGDLERRLSVVDKLEATVEDNLKQAGALRQSILMRAFSGELVPQDPDDEPASALLERIREERQAAKQKKPGGGRRSKTGPTEREHAEQGGLF